MHRHSQKYLSTPTSHVKPYLDLTVLRKPEGQACKGFSNITWMNIKMDHLYQNSLQQFEIILHPAALSQAQLNRLRMKDYTKQCETICQMAAFMGSHYF